MKHNYLIIVFSFLLGSGAINPGGHFSRAMQSQEEGRSSNPSRSSGVSLSKTRKTDGFILTDGQFTIVNPLLLKEWPGKLGNREFMEIILKALDNEEDQMKWRDISIKYGPEKSNADQVRLSNLCSDGIIKSIVEQFKNNPPEWIKKLSAEDDRRRIARKARTKTQSAGAPQQKRLRLANNGVERQQVISSDAEEASPSLESASCNSGTFQEAYPSQMCGASFTPALFVMEPEKRYDLSEAINGAWGDASSILPSSGYRILPEICPSQVYGASSSTPAPFVMDFEEEDRLGNVSEVIKGALRALDNASSTSPAPCNSGMFQETYPYQVYGASSTSAFPVMEFEEEDLLSGLTEIELDNKIKDALDEILPSSTYSAPQDYQSFGGMFQNLYQVYEAPSASTWTPGWPEKFHELLDPSEKWQNTEGLYRDFI